MFEPLVGAEFPLDRADGRARALEARRHVAKVVLSAVKALVTGAAGGLGSAISARLEREGYDVVRLDVTTGFDVSDPTRGRTSTPSTLRL